MSFLKKLKKVVKKAGGDIEDAFKKTIKYTAPGAKQLLDQLTGKTAMKAQQKMAQEEAKRAQEQADQAARENRTAAQTAAASAAMGEAMQAATAAAAEAGKPTGQVDIDIEDGSLADPRRRRRYTPGAGLPLSI